MKQGFNFKKIIVLLLGLLIVYVVYTVCNIRKADVVQQAIQQARIEIALKMMRSMGEAKATERNHIISQVISAQCQPVRLFTEDWEINIIEAECVQQ